MKTEPLVIERVLNAPVEQVWQAITDPKKIREWYFAMEDFKPEPGFEFRFTGGKDEKTFLHICRVTEVIPNRKLRHTWSYQGYPGLSHVTMELFAEGNKTRFRLTHEGLETFPQDTGDFARENFHAGWTQIIGTTLREYVEGKSAEAHK